MPEGHIGEVEVDAFEQQVGGDERVGVAGGEDCGVVAHGVLGGVVGHGELVGESVNEAELAE